MRMYEAMRLGALIWPQAFGNCFEEDTGARCARATALEAMKLDWGAKPPIERIAFDGPCPAYAFCGEPLFGIASVIVHLNDEHRWTREQIADWLEPIEEAFYAKREKEKEHALVER